MIGGIVYPSGTRLSSSIRPCFLSTFNKRKSAVIRCHYVSCRTFCSTHEEKKNRVLVISGPTGAGKSRFALELAKRLDGEIISADSVQVYQGLDVGSAKPLSSDRKEVPHHLLDILHPAAEYSAGKFYEDARKITEHIINKGRVPIVVGGTGLYLRWYIYGKPSVPVASEDTASKVCSSLDHFESSGQWDAAVELVCKSGDPKAHRIANNDWYRLRRSLEVLESSGSPPSAFQVPYDAFRTLTTAEKLDVPKSLDYDFLCFFLSSIRVNLYRSIDFRCEEMLMGEPGILTEASWLLDIGLLPNSNSATRAIGYRQAMEYLSHCRKVNGQCSPGDFYSFLSEFQKASRNFAKRQMTWFRNEHIYHWLDASKPFGDVLNFVCDSYRDRSGNVMVPEFLKMKKDITGRLENNELKGYHPKNRIFVSEEDCLNVLSWIRQTQKQQVTNGSL